MLLFGILKVCSLRHLCFVSGRNTAKNSNCAYIAIEFATSVQPLFFFFFLSCLLCFLFDFFVHQIPPEPLLPPRAIEQRLIYARQCVRQGSVCSSVTFGSPFMEPARTQDNHARVEAINVIDVR